MNHLTHACSSILSQLSDVILQVEDNQYTAPSKTLSGSSVGQHLRHTLEFFICLEQGYTLGVINYDKRAHDQLMETDKELALRVIDQIKAFINRQSVNKILALELGYDLADEENVSVQTNYWRELTYNIEHAVHHMAIMKIGIREVAPQVSISPDFGVAASTLRYRNEIMTEAH